MACPLARSGPCFQTLMRFMLPAQREMIFHLVFFGGHAEFFLKRLDGESEHAIGVEFSGVNLHALEASFLGEGDAFDGSPVAEGGLHDGELLG